MIAFKNGGPKNPAQPGISTPPNHNSRPLAFGGILEIGPANDLASRPTLKVVLGSPQDKKAEDTRRLHALLENWLAHAMSPSPGASNAKSLLAYIRDCKEADFISPSETKPHNTPLILACAIRDPELIDFIIDKLREKAGGSKLLMLAYLTKDNEYGNTALHAIAGRETIEEVATRVIKKIMQESGVTKDGLSAADTYWRTAPVEPHHAATPDPDFLMPMAWVNRLLGAESPTVPRKERPVQKEANFIKEGLCFGKIRDAGITDAQLSAFMREDQSSNSKSLSFEILTSAMIQADATREDFEIKNRFNSGQTPLDYARAMGNKTILPHLESLIHELFNPK